MIYSFLFAHYKSNLIDGLASILIHTIQSTLTFSILTSASIAEMATAFAAHVIACVPAFLDPVTTMRTLLAFITLHELKKLIVFFGPFNRSLILLTSLPSMKWYSTFQTIMLPTFLTFKFKVNIRIKMENVIASSSRAARQIFILKGCCVNLSRQKFIMHFFC